MESFTILGGGYYTKDKWKVYCCGEQIEGADAATFKLINTEITQCYGEDKNYKYYRGEHVEENIIDAD